MFLFVHNLPHYMSVPVARCYTYMCTISTHMYAYIHIISGAVNADARKKALFDALAEPAKDVPENLKVLFVDH